MSVIEVIDQPSQVDIDRLTKGLADFMQSSLSIGTTDRPLGILARDSDGAVTGGLLGKTGWDQFFISTLFVDERERRRGLGRKIIAAGEREARVRGCQAAWLMTSDEGAKAFYENVGYTVFGSVPRRASLAPRYFMSKVL